MLWFPSSGISSKLQFSPGRGLQSRRGADLLLPSKIFLLTAPSLQPALRLPTPLLGQAERTHREFKASIQTKSQGPARQQLPALPRTQNSDGPKAAGCNTSALARSAFPLSPESIIFFFFFLSFFKLLQRPSYCYTC